MRRACLSEISVVDSARQLQALQQFGRPIKIGEQERKRSAVQHCDVQTTDAAEMRP